MTEPVALYSVDAEQSVLGAVLLSNRALPAIVIEEGLRPDDFYHQPHRLIYTAMLDLAEQGVSIDHLTIGAQLERTGKLADVGGKSAVEALYGPVPNVGNVRRYAARVIELAQLRTVRSAGYQLVVGAESQDAGQIAEAERLLARRVQAGRVHTVDGAGWRDDVLAYLEADQVEAFPLPWGKLNDAMGGLRRGESTTVGAWTNFGKSPLIDQVLDHAATRSGAKAHLYSNEGSRQQRALRNIARVSGVSLTRLTKRDLSPSDYSSVTQALKEPLSFGYTDCAGWSAEDIARDLQWRRYDIAALDMLHNVDFKDEAELRIIVNTLVTAAILADCHLLLAVHFNEERAKQSVLPPPVLRDIRGSGMIKNRVDNVLMLHREQEIDDNDLAVMKDDATAWFAKVRYGEPAAVPLVFDGSRQRFLLPARDPLLT